MPKTTDYATRAAEFLKAWQAQMTRQMNDPDTIRSMLAAMQAFGVQPPHDENPRKPATAPDARDDAIRRLERRVHALEQQLAELSASVLPVAAKTKNPAGASKRRSVRHTKPAAKPVVRSKRGVAKKPKSKPTRKK